MNKLTIGVLLFANILCAATLELAVGQRKKVSTGNVKKIVVQNPEIADISIDENSRQATITGLSAGATTVDLVEKSGTKTSLSIHVITASQFNHQNIQSGLEDIEGIETYTSGDTTIIDGDIYRVEDFQKIKKFLRRYGHVKNQSRFHPKVLDYLGKQLQEELIKNKFPELIVQVMPNTLLVKGETRNKREAEQVERIVKAIFPDATIDITNQLAKENSTLVDIKFLEVRKSNMADIGMKWPASFYADGNLSLYGNAKSSSLVIGAQSPLTFSALVEKGIVRVLSNPKVLCKTGRPASFLAGGEIPIRLISERTASVSFKQYGINLELTAKLDRSENISLDIFAKISDIDSSVSIEGLPGFIEHHIQTSVDLKMDETVVLAGLLENKNRKNVSKFPLLGHVPVLGELFKSRSFQNNESEFLVTLTPTNSNSVNARQKHQSLDLGSRKPLSFSLLD